MPLIRILSPFFRWRVTSPTMSPNIASHCFFGTSWFSASDAARCLRVTVACAAALAGAAVFGDLAADLAAGAFLSAMADRLAVAVGLQHDGIMVFPTGQAILAFRPRKTGHFSTLVP